MSIELLNHAGKAVHVTGVFLHEAAETPGRSHLIVEAWDCGHGDFIKCSGPRFTREGAERRIGKRRRCLWCAGRLESFAKPTIEGEMQSFGLLLLFERAKVGGLQP